jgi:hypothetical protein
MSASNAGHAGRVQDDNAKDRPMTRIIALSIAIAAGSMAQASDDYAKMDSAKAEQIKSQLTEQGYEVRKIETEDGMYEAYALKDGARYEIYLDKELNIVKTELDD